MPDIHVGFERKHGKLSPLHDEGAITGVMQFVRDFKPDVVILGGDTLDCGPVSHWLKNKKSSIQELDLQRDAELAQRIVVNPINKLVPKAKKVFMLGNHEEWLSQAVEESPGLKNILKVEQLLDLKGWQVIEQGGNFKLGHLYFIHGDTLGNVKNIADQAMTRYGRALRFGHFHTFQVSTKYTALDQDQAMTAIAVPGLCNKNPNYMEGKPNQWLKGFNYGYSLPNGNFHDFVSVIIDKRFVANGKLYNA